MAQQRRYGDHRPYPDPPEKLSDLTGPTAGLVDLPITIDWGPKRLYDLGEAADRRILCERVLQEAASTEEIGRFVNGSVLVDIWPHLWLPARVRQRWESRFQELRPSGHQETSR